MCCQAGTMIISHSLTMRGGVGELGGDCGRDGPFCCEMISSSLMRGGGASDQVVCWPQELLGSSSGRTQGSLKISATHFAMTVEGLGLEDDVGGRIGVLEQQRSPVARDFIEMPRRVPKQRQGSDKLGLGGHRERERRSREWGIQGPEWRC